MTQMTSREIIQANINASGAPRPGFNFPGDMQRDLCIAGLGQAENFNSKRWVEDIYEHYYDDWGNEWKRVVDGCVKGEVCRPFLDDWSKISQIIPPIH